jgi:hypothetical protein
MNNDSSYELPKGHRVDVITSVERRRRWAPAEKKRIVEKTYEPGYSVSYVARLHGISPAQLFNCKCKSTENISVGGFGLSCALLTNSTVKCWGDNASYDKPSVGAFTLENLSNVKKVSVGSFHTCSLLNNGEAWCMGRNTDGQLGDISLGSFSNQPVRVTGISGATDLESSTSHVCAIRAAGAVSCWGSNNHGQLGDGAHYNFLVTPELVER